MIFVWNSRQLNFNSRTHVECDWRFPYKGSAHYDDFNSRTHVECDGLVLFCDLFLFHFNSRTHVECDGSPHVLR